MFDVLSASLVGLCRSNFQLAEELFFTSIQRILLVLEKSIGTEDVKRRLMQRLWGKAQFILVHIGSAGDGPGDGSSGILIVPFSVIPRVMLVSPLAMPGRERQPLALAGASGGSSASCRCLDNAEAPAIPSNSI